MTRKRSGQRLTTIDGSDLDPPVGAAAEPPPVESTGDDSTPEKPETDSAEEEIPAERRCPLCWNGRRGVGVAYHTDRQTRYYKCVRSTRRDDQDKPELGCGHTWSVRVVREVGAIRHRTIDVRGRDAA